MAGLDTISAIGPVLEPGSPGGRTDEQGRAFLQGRVAKVGLFGGGLGGAFALWRLVEAAVIGNWGGVRHVSFGWHVAGAAFLLVMGLGCRWGVRSRRFVEVIEVVGLVGSCVAYCGMGATMPAVGRPDWLVYAALTSGLTIRAIYVPSTAWRSAVLALLIGVPFLAMVHHSSGQIGSGQLADTLAYNPKATLVWMQRGNTYFLGAWWVATVVITAAASRVIYGLRHEVRSIRRLGQYALEAPLGEGGMGVVYRASHAMLQRPTAVKLLPAERLGEASLARFEREVQLTAKLTHPNTITVFDYGRTPEGVFYYAMELIDGATLDKVVDAEGALPPGRVIHILRQAAGALAEAHDIGLIHRDIKPENIMLCEQGGVPDRVKVLDFGLVKQVDAPDSASLTGTNVITGTPQYMPPEALNNPRDIDGRADLYALAAVGYLLLTGRPVFEGATLVEICSHHLLSTPTPPSELNDAVPEDLEQVLLECLAKEPGQRPASARELRAALERCADHGAWTDGDAQAWWAEHGARLLRPAGLSSLVPPAMRS